MSKSPLLAAQPTPAEAPAERFRTGRVAAANRDRAGGLETLDALGWLLSAALPPLRLQQLSVHDVAGDVRWLSEGTVGPVEQACARHAARALAVDAAPEHYERSLEDGRITFALPLRDDQGAVTGVAMLFADGKAVQPGLPSRVFTPHLRDVLRRMAQYLAPSSDDHEPILSDREVEQLLTGSRAVATRTVEACAPRVRALLRLRSGARTHRYEVLPDGGAGPGARGSGMHGPAPARAAISDARRTTSSIVEWLGEHPGIWEAEPASFCIPVTALTLADEGFLDVVSGALSRSGVLAECIGFLLPEGVARERRADAKRFLATCERLGLGVVLDRFTLDSGVVTLLESRAVRALAIDPQLTKSVGHERLARARVAAIVQAARVLGLHCIADHVDAEVARQWLGGIGVDFMRSAAPGDLQDLDSVAAGNRRASSTA